ncbi:hypothetical protein FACS189440_18880 [Bacteroidia bacterium]|nr:hypothetical protein FACS189440_18880 [Bacteroidia bacterium]
MSRICLIYNYAQHYRKNIFSLIDKEFLCDFYFGDDMGDVKKMDYSLLQNNVIEVKNKMLLSRIHWQVGVWKLIFKKEYSHFILLGQVDSLSTWIFVLLSVFFSQKKIYFWMHGWYGNETKVKKMIKRVFLSFTDGVFLYGDYAKNLMIKEGIPASKLHVIYNSLDYDAQISVRNSLKESNIYTKYFNNNYPNLIFIGRLTDVKKLPLLIEAINIAKQCTEYYNLTLIGDGEKRVELEGLVQKYGLTNHVCFYGSCYDEQEIAELVYNADLCVSPGNVGLTAMHAMAYGTPVLTHDNYPYQMPEFEAIKEGRTGYFFEYDNVYSLSQRIQDCIGLTIHNRQEIRNNCFRVIDEKYNPYEQIKTIKSVLAKS